MHGTRSISLLAVALLALPALASGQATHKMRTSVMGAGGAPASSASFRTNATLGQPTPIGILAGTGEVLYAGFWGRFWALTPVDEAPAPLANRLFQNYPNPFNPATAIDYSVAAPCRVEVAVYDAGGRRIRTLVSESKAPGAYKVFWNGRNDRGALVATGIYFYRARIGAYSDVRKMVLLR